MMDVRLLLNLIKLHANCSS